LVGAIVGLAGGVVGAPLGAFLAWILATVFHDRLPAGFVLSTFGLALALAGAIAAGVLGAAWPAWSASRVRPLEALASRAATPRTRTLVLSFVLGVALLAAQATVVLLTDDGQTLFW